MPPSTTLTGYPLLLCGWTANIYGMFLIICAPFAVFTWEAPLLWASQPLPDWFVNLITPNQEWNVVGRGLYVFFVSEMLIAAVVFYLPGKTLVGDDLQ